MGDIGERKADHIELCATGDVGFRAKTTMLEDVEFVHEALPELALDDIDTRVTLFGKKLRFPLIIAAMTGGTERAREINRELAGIAEERGYGFGLGSQRAMLNGDRGATYKVRDVAPTALVLGNIGAVQARSLSTDQAAELVESVGADALCVHLNPAMEIIQSGGDRYFAGALGAIERLVEELSTPIVAKETGCGIGPRTAERLAKAGVRHVDVSGAGGTSWVAVETERAPAGGTGIATRSLGQALREWGIPTAASVVCMRRTRPRYKTIIATGGISTGVESAKAIALGAHAVGIARPVLQALIASGRQGVLANFDQIEAELKAVMLLVGAGSIAELRRAPLVLSGGLPRWVELAKRGGRRL